MISTPSQSNDVLHSKNDGVQAIQTPQKNLSPEKSVAKACPQSLVETQRFSADQTWVPFDSAPRAIPEEFAHFHILDKIGQGGMGVVYLAEDNRTGDQVALKIPNLPRENESHWKSTLQTEGRAAGAIDHPHVCPVFETSEHDGHVYMTMPYLRGESLADWMDKHPTSDVEVALTIVRKMALGIQAAHEAGVVHRDLKPANVMLEPGFEPRIIDFSAACMIGDCDDCEPVATRQGMVGTICYMAPEQISGEHDCSTAVDVYALGLILYELLTGRRPYEGSLSTLMGAIVCDPPSPPSSLRSDIDENVAAICLKALEKNPCDRFGSAAEMAEAIENVLAACCS